MELSAETAAVPFFTSTVAGTLVPSGAIMEDEPLSVGVGGAGGGAVAPAPTDSGSSSITAPDGTKVPATVEVKNLSLIHILSAKGGLYLRFGNATTGEYGNPITLLDTSKEIGNPNLTCLLYTSRCV